MTLRVEFVLVDCKTPYTSLNETALKRTFQSKCPGLATLKCSIYLETEEFVIVSKEQYTALNKHCLGVSSRGWEQASTQDVCAAELQYKVMYTGTENSRDFKNAHQTKLVLAKLMP
ncbi:hypothetical protein WISP_121865 [Willisornis vidua]|uniref:Uncharacterized protein n=1 Tax=Willisornis vidua TaxID=1566151 RepID=A0ABQ9CS99_9PASS|nr:hypothetical protein WISP_121865 [Willisornis vidua]